MPGRAGRDEAVLPAALALAEAHGGKVLLAPVSPQAPRAVAPGRQEIASLLTRLDADAALLDPAPQPPAGNPAALARRARETRADLAVTALPAEASDCPEAEALLARARIPVLMLRGDARAYSGMATTS